MTLDTALTSDEYQEYFASTLRNALLVQTIKEISTKYLPGLSKEVLPKMTHLFTEKFTNTQPIQKFIEGYASKIEHYLSLDELQLTWIEILICRDVQVFDYYLSRMLTKVFTQRREVLKGLDYTLKLNDLLECADINEAILRASEKQIHDLGYLGLHDIIKYLKGHFKMKIDTASQEFQFACEMVEVRNIIVHNGGYVSAKFIAKTLRTEFKVGDKFPLTEEFAEKMENNLLLFASTLDQEFSSHFKLI